jgi:hypothetical protein
MTKLSEYERKSIEKLAQTIQEGKWSNDGLVQLFEVIGSYCNLETISDYSKRTGLSYNGTKNHRQTTEIFGIKFVIDNE